MKQATKLVSAVFIAALLLGAYAMQGHRAAAQSPARQTTVIVPYTDYEWWLIRWADNAILCVVHVDHEGLPTIKEVSASCGADLADEWWSTPPCDPEMPSGECAGVYLYQASSAPKEKEMTVELPSPQVWVSLEGCSPIPPENLCTQIPVLVLTGEEPLPNERIIAIQGIYDGAPFYCEGEICKLPLSTTPITGIPIEFWADSSYGDSSQRFAAQVRVIDSGVANSSLPDGQTPPPEATPGSAGWYVDIISAQWNGPALASCAKIWEAFPPAGGMPSWLTTPGDSALLASGEPYYYLAGRLISQGVVDASACQSGGLLPNGYADACGLEMARPVVEDWQNQFDSRINEVADETGVPAQIMKNLFAQESQFWPGMFRVPYEVGIGQITDQGMDPIFMWNPDFFQQFCPLILSEEACAGGYLSLTEEARGILRGALALQASADCADCPTGIDLTNVYFTVSLFANTLQANCAQVARTVFTATEQMAGRVATYEDLWRLTIANYHAGPGCVSFAIHQAWQTETTLNWEVVKTRFTEPCMGVVPYVEKITQ